MILKKILITVIILTVSISIGCSKKQSGPQLRDDVETASKVSKGEIVVLYAQSVTRKTIKSEVSSDVTFEFRSTNTSPVTTLYEKGSALDKIRPVTKLILRIDKIWKVNFLVDKTPKEGTAKVEIHVPTTSKIEKDADPSGAYGFIGINK
jgi:hypothetical protein